MQDVSDFFDVSDLVGPLTTLRRDIHAHPELGFAEFRTAARIAQVLTEAGLEVHQGIGGTGLVGVLRVGDGTRCVGLRADMDALPFNEETGLPWASVTPGSFHGCGHDGHVAMLLGAAQAMAKARDFSGTIHFIFQPAEEGQGGARAIGPDRRTGTIGDVAHIVVLMQENRSFDHYFGTMPGVRGFGDRFPIPVDGGAHGMRTVWDQQDGPAHPPRLIRPFPISTQAHYDLMRMQGTPHNWPSAQAAWDHGRMGHWP